MLNKKVNAFPHAILRIFHTPHFPYSAFSTLSILRIFHTPHFPYSSFSILRTFHTPHFPYSALSILRIFHTPHSAFSIQPFFHDKQNSGNTEKDEFESLAKRKSNWTPPEGKFGSVDLFIRKCRHDIRKLNFSQTIKFSNLNADEWAALKSFRSRKDVTIKPADKGGAVVVWRTDLYKQEAARQLADSKFYVRTEKDLTLDNQKVVKTTINELISNQKLPSTAHQHSQDIPHLLSTQNSQN